MNDIDKIKFIAAKYIKILKSLKEVKEIFLSVLNDVDFEIDDMNVDGGSFSWKPDKGRKYISASLLNTYLGDLIAEAKEINNVLNIPEKEEMKKEIEKRCTKTILPKWKLKIKIGE